jgi:hypothetical protein
MSDFLDLYDDAPLRRVLFLGAILLIVVPFIQAGSQLWPLQFGNIQWRFGAANALSAVLLLPFLGLTLLLMISRATESSSLGKTVGVLSAVFAVSLAGSFVVFLLDALQLKTIVSTQMESQFKTTAARVGLMTAMFAMAFLMLALAGFKGPRGSAVRSGGSAKRGNAVQEDAAEEEEDASTGLIVGR